MTKPRTDYQWRSSSADKATRRRRSFCSIFEKHDGVNEGRHAPMPSDCASSRHMSVRRPHRSQKARRRAIKRRARAASTVMICTERCSKCGGSRRIARQRRSTTMEEDSTMLPYCRRVLKSSESFPEYLLLSLLLPSC